MDGGPIDSTIDTKEFARAVVPPTGVCEITVPFGSIPGAKDDVT
jgi:hypothetical protein